MKKAYTSHSVELFCDINLIVIALQLASRHRERLLEIRNKKYLQIKNK